MAKLNFKDLIFKFLQKDEDHDCKKVHPKMSHKEWMNTEPVSMYKGESYKSDYEKEQPIKVKKAIEEEYYPAQVLIAKSQGGWSEENEKSEAVDTDLKITFLD